MQDNFVHNLLIEKLKKYLEHSAKLLVAISLIAVSGCGLNPFRIYSVLSDPDIILTPENNKPYIVLSFRIDNINVFYDLSVRVRLFDVKQVVLQEEKILAGGELILVLDDEELYTEGNYLLEADINDPVNGNILFHGSESIYYMGYPYSMKKKITLYPY